jgi:hypothetical protein
MKWLIRAIALCTAVTIGLTAGTVRAQPDLRPGIEVGYGYSMLEFDYEPEAWTSEGRFVFSGGAFVEVMLYEKLRLLPAVRYVRYGNMIDVNSGVDPVSQFIGEIEFTQDYLAFPILAKFKPVKRAGFFIVAGPEIAFLVKASRKRLIREIVNQTQLVIVNDDDVDIKDQMETFNLSGIIGAGQQRLFRGRVITAQIRLNYGAVSTAKKDDVFFYTWETRLIEFLIGAEW